MLEAKFGIAATPAMFWSVLNHESVRVICSGLERHQLAEVYTRVCKLSPTDACLATYQLLFSQHKDVDDPPAQIMDG